MRAWLTSYYQKVIILMAILAGSAVAGVAYAARYDMTEQAIDQRIAPSGKVRVDGVAEVDASETDAGRTPQSIYETYCLVCHATGVAGAPRIGVAADWEPRLAQGRDQVIANSISGIRAMPARGTCFDCSDEEIAATVDYMLSQ